MVPELRRIDPPAAELADYDRAARARTVQRQHTAAGNSCARKKSSPCAGATSSCLCTAARNGIDSQGYLVSQRIEDARDAGTSSSLRPQCVKATAGDSRVWPHSPTLELRKPRGSIPAILPTGAGS